MLNQVGVGEVVGDATCGFRAVWQLCNLSQRPHQSRATVQQTSNSPIYLLLPPLGPVVDLDPKTSHLSKDDILATRQMVYEFAGWISDLPVGAPVGNYTEGGRVLSQWFSTI